MTAKEYRLKHGVENVRGHVTTEQLMQLDRLQIIDTALIELGESYEARKARLTDYFNQNYRLAIAA